MRVGHAAVLAGVVVTCVPLVAQQVSTPPVFRSSIDLVSVNVSVRRGNQPVDGLGLTDFRVTDNGVLQSLRTIGRSDVPVDVTFVISTGGRVGARFAQFHADIVKAAALLRADDRLRALEFGANVVEVLPLQSASDQLPVRLAQASRAAPGGLQAIQDALVAALILPTDPHRRQLVIACIERIDEASILSPAKLLAVAQRTEAVLYLLRFPLGYAREPESVLRSVFGDYPFRLFGEMDVLHAQESLRSAAAATGGRVYEPGFLPKSLAETFRGILDAYRQSYVLQYELNGTPREGWHDLKVDLAKSGRYDVKAREGYFVDRTIQ